MQPDPFGSFFLSPRLPFVGFFDSPPKPFAMVEFAETLHIVDVEYSFSANGVLSPA